MELLYLIRPYFMGMFPYHMAIDMRTDLGSDQKAIGDFNPKMELWQHRF